MLPGDSNRHQMRVDIQRQDHRTERADRGQRAFDLVPAHFELAASDIGKLVQDLHADGAPFAEKRERSLATGIVGEGIDDDIGIDELPRGGGNPLAKHLISISIDPHPSCTDVAALSGKVKQHQLAQVAFLTGRVGGGEVD